MQSITQLLIGLCLVYVLWGALMAGVKPDSFIVIGASSATIERN